MSLASHAHAAINFSSLHLNPVLLQIGPFALRWYSLAYIAGIFLGWFYLTRLLAEAGAPMTRDQADDMIGWVTAGIILGGRLAYVLFYDPGTYLSAPLKTLELWAGGMSFHGGAVGVAVAIFAFAARHRLKWLRVLDYVAMCAPIGLFLGRIANFVNGELWGRPTNAPWGVYSPAVAPSRATRASSMKPSWRDRYYS